MRRHDETNLHLVTQHTPTSNDITIKRMKQNNNNRGLMVRSLETVQMCRNNNNKDCLSRDSNFMFNVMAGVLVWG
jgi:hypothetical protein